MKTIYSLLFFLFLSLPAFPQGPLTPPGAPAPTMKTLDQVEARTPISTVPFTITNPGSYYLTTNVNVTTGDAITINTNQVTLDLNRFTISSTATSATGTGINLALAAGNSDITILNGHIKGGVTYNAGTYNRPGFAYGIYYTAVPYNVRVTGVSVSGCLIYGIYLNALNTVVESCRAQTCGATGIEASGVSHSTAYSCGNYGIIADTASDCYGRSEAGIGLFVNTAQNCYGTSNGGQGIYALTAQNCYGGSNSSQGIYAETASNCYGESNSNRGIFANVAFSCSGYCNGGSYGLFATSIANTCYGKSGTGTGLNASIAIGCIGANNSGPSVSYTYHYNMPP